MGTVDYRLVSSFVRRLRENAPADGRCARADVQRLAALAAPLRPPEAAGPPPLRHR
jgi:hypothetical protein